MALVTKKGINVSWFEDEQEFQERISYYTEHPAELLSTESKAAAWNAVYKCLTDLTGSNDWLFDGRSGTEAACNTISKLARKE